jgi:3-hydroxybutyryl-CoA dehydrogenase
MMEDNKVGIVGAGMMGAEIALCFAASGYEVSMKDETLELAQKGKSRLENVLNKAVKKGTFQAKAKDSTLSRITPTDQYGVFKDTDLVIEAVFEDLGTKKSVLSELDKICKPDCVFATNTSSIPITLVEVIPGLETENETVKFMMECCRSIGKTPVRVKDVTGFAVNRILHAMWIEANRLLEEGVATPEDIDTACKLGLGHPVGPYALMDLTGNDLNLRVQEILQGEYGERFRPRPILKQKVHANHLGRKTGRGWYGYGKEK